MQASLYFYAKKCQNPDPNNNLYVLDQEFKKVNQKQQGKSSKICNNQIWFRLLQDSIYNCKGANDPLKGYTNIILFQNMLIRYIQLYDKNTHEKHKL